MAKQNVSFVAVKTVKTQVKFETKSGQTVSFKALKTIRKPLHSRAKNKRA